MKYWRTLRTFLARSSPKTPQTCKLSGNCSASKIRARWGSWANSELFIMLCQPELMPHFAVLEIKDATQNASNSTVWHRLVRKIFSQISSDRPRRPGAILCGSHVHVIQAYGRVLAKTTTSWPSLHCLTIGDTGHDASHSLAIGLAGCSGGCTSRPRTPTARRS